MNPLAIGMVGLAAVGGFALWRSGMVSPKPGKHFEWSEFEVSSTAAQRGLDNSLPLTARPRVTALVRDVLDPLRDDLGRPIRITSGYRSPEVNRAIGGSISSDHLTGGAADIMVAGMQPEAVARRIVALGLPFDQVIAYHPDRGGHLHVGHRPGAQRGQLLYAPAEGGFITLRLR